MDAGEIAQRVVGQIGENGVGAAERAGHQERVAVRLRLGDDAGTEGAAGAAAVLDHHRLADLPG